MIYGVKSKDECIKVESTEVHVVECGEEHAIKATVAIAKDAPICIKDNLFAYVAKNKEEIVIYDISKQEAYIKITFAIANTIECMDISCDKKFLSVGTVDGKLNIFSFIGQKLVLSLTVFKNEKVENVSFLENGIVALSSQKTIRIIDAIGRKNIKKILAENKVGILKNNNNILYYSCDSKLISYDLEKERETEIFSKFDSHVQDIIFIKNDELFIITEFKFYLIDLKDNEILSKKTLKNGYKDIFYNEKQQKLMQYLNEKEIVVLDDESNDNKKEENKQELKKLKFLTVDDSATMRLIITKAIQNNVENVEVFEAENGKDALLLLKNNPDMDVIFLDWNMPVMNGEEVVDAIAREGKYKVKIIMATTEGAGEKVKKMISKGVSGYLIKPFNPKAVATVAKKMAEACRGE